MPLGSYLLLCVLLTGCATRPWTKQEKMLLGVSCIAAATDTYTTTQSLNNEYNWEVNPVLGKNPSDTEIITYMITSQIIAIVLAHYIPKYRNWILGIKTGLNTAGTINNLTLDWNE